MASDNLIHLNERPKEEQKKIAAMGGKASGEARRQKKKMRETLGELKSIEEDKLADNIGKVEDLLSKLNEEAKK